MSTQTNLPPMGVPGVDRAVSQLESSGYTVRFDHMRLHYVVVKTGKDGWRHDGLTCFGLIALANQLQEVSVNERNSTTTG